MLGAVQASTPCTAGFELPIPEMARPSSAGTRRAQSALGRGVTDLGATRIIAAASTAVSVPVTDPRRDTSTPASGLGRLSACPSALSGAAHLRDRFRCVEIVRAREIAARGAMCHARAREDWPKHSTTRANGPPAHGRGVLRTRWTRPRNVVLPIPSPSRRGPQRRAINSTSPILERWSERIRLPLGHAASTAAARSCCPQRTTRPSRRWPPSISSVYIGSSRRRSTAARQVNTPVSSSATPRIQVRYRANPNRSRPFFDLDREVDHVAGCRAAAIHERKRCFVANPARPLPWPFAKPACSINQAAGSSHCRRRVTPERHRSAMRPRRAETSSLTTGS